MMRQDKEKKMAEYHKIPTVWARDPATKHRTLIDRDWATPELEMLSGMDWVFTEKVDGTNVRVLYDAEAGAVEFRGRTDRAQMPPQLLRILKALFPVSALRSAFDCSVCLYGEGYGKGIQKAGTLYDPDGQSFVLFDVAVGGLFLERSNVEEIARNIGLVPPVPIVGRGSLMKMIDLVRAGMPSSWGDFTAEGIVARPMFELKDRTGKRIITKVKAKDFPRDG